MSVTINGTSGLVFNDASTQNTAATGFGFKNRIINGAMMIDQRNAGASFTTTSSAYTLDRWVSINSATSKYTIQQDAGAVTPPVGFVDYLGCTSTAATTVSSGDYYHLSQPIEGFNTADLAWGTASASPVTLSFWVRSSLTGTFGGALRNAATNRSYPFSFTVSSANTWEQKSLTIVGDTTGTWVTNNGIGILLTFSLGTGSSFSGTAGSWQAGNLASATGATNVVSTNGATFYITGVQLEKGSTATSFDYRPYGTELALCQRYYYRIKAATGNSRFGSGGLMLSSTGARTIVPFLVTMRVAPTSLDTSGTAGDYASVYGGGSTTANSVVPAFDSSTTDAANLTITTASGMSSGGYFQLVATGAGNGFLGFSAEL